MRNFVVMSAVLLLLPLAGAAGARDLSRYPCTVFNADACFRLPAGTHVEYSVPADFDFYEVSKEGRLIATIYIGNAPKTVKSPVAPIASELANATIKIYRGGATSAEVLDIYIVPKAKDASTVHISAGLNPSTGSELKELLSGFRPCKPIKSGGQRCPPSTAWSKELAKALTP